MYIKTGESITIARLFPRYKCWYCYDPNHPMSYDSIMTTRIMGFWRWEDRFMKNSRRRWHWTTPAIIEAVRKNNRAIAMCRGHEYMLYWAIGHECLIRAFVSRLNQAGINRKNINSFLKSLTNETG